MSTERAYEGGELDLFLAAKRWKSYWSGRIKPHIGETVLEVGAGFGSNTPYLHGEKRKRWVCLEPDSNLANQISSRLQEHAWAGAVEARVGTLDDFQVEELFDTILYVDVLEHIKADKDEMCKAASHLRPGGKLVVLSPAHQWLYSRFDRAIGHYRRYTKSTLKACTPSGTSLVELYYLDSVGLMASAANKLFLRQSMPTIGQIMFWDRWLVSASCQIDWLIGFGLGKTVVGVWLKNQP